MINKGIINDILKTQDFGVIEKHLVYSFVQNNNLYFQKSPIIKNLLTDFEPKTDVYLKLSGLEIRDLKQLENYLELLIPKTAKRSSATSRKCRAEFVKVLKVFGADEGVSQHDESVKYKVGDVVGCHKWDKNRWNECSGGIHFFITRAEAENY